MLEYSNQSLSLKPPVVDRLEDTNFSLPFRQTRSGTGCTQASYIGNRIRPPSRQRLFPHPQNRKVRGDWRTRESRIKTVMVQYRMDNLCPTRETRRLLAPPHRQSYAWSRESIMPIVANLSCASDSLETFFQRNTGRIQGYVRLKSFVPVIKDVVLTLTSIIALFSPRQNWVTEP